MVLRPHRSPKDIPHARRPFTTAKAHFSGPKKVTGLRGLQLPHRTQALRKMSGADVPLLSLFATLACDSAAGKSRIEILIMLTRLWTKAAACDSRSEAHRSQKGAWSMRRPSRQKSSNEKVSSLNIKVRLHVILVFSLSSMGSSFGSFSDSCLELASIQFWRSMKQADVLNTAQQNLLRMTDCAMLPSAK